jgi:hypothetical protein
LVKDDLTQLEPEKIDDNSPKTKEFNNQVAATQSPLLQLTGQLPPRPNIIPTITGDSSVKDLGASLIEALTDLTVNLEAKTRITANSRPVYTKAMVLALRYGPVDKDGLPEKNNVLWNYVIQDLKLATSEKGQRVRDVVDISKGIAKIEADAKAQQAKDIKV